jgi:hypothetical protein
MRISGRSTRSDRLSRRRQDGGLVHPIRGIGDVRQTDCDDASHRAHAGKTGGYHELGSIHCSGHQAHDPSSRGQHLRSMLSLQRLQPHPMFWPFESFLSPWLRPAHTQEMPAGPSPRSTTVGHASGSTCCAIAANRGSAATRLLHAQRRPREGICEAMNLGLSSPPSRGRQRIVLCQRQLNKLEGGGPGKHRLSESTLNFIFSVMECWIPAFAWPTESGYAPAFARNSITRATVGSSVWPSTGTSQYSARGRHSSR